MTIVYYSVSVVSLITLSVQPPTARWVHDEVCLHYIIIAHLAYLHTLHTLVDWLMYKEFDIFVS